MPFGIRGCPSATASSGLTVAFTVTSGAGAIANGTNLTFTGAGSVTITASQAGNANWNAASDVSRTFNVNSLPVPRSPTLERWPLAGVKVRSTASVTASPHTVRSPKPTSDVPSSRAPAFEVMINSALYLTRAAVPLMKDGGRIVHVTSIHGDRAEALASSYSMAKAAINQFCRVLAIELAPRGILVNALAPGFIDTPMSVVNGVNELESDWFKQNYIQGHHLPLKRAARPEEIAGVAFFLAGPDASYITGQVITVDGGLTITF